MRAITAAILLAIFTATAFAESKPAAKPVSHTEREIEGWKVRIDDRLLSPTHDELGERALKILATRLYDVKSVVVAAKVKRLQQVTIWLDLTHGDLKSAQYHPGEDWLKDNGYSQDLVKCVHIPDAAYFCDKLHQHEQPWAVMHELAHAYHDQVLDFENPQIKSAWQKFKEGGRYRSAMHISGKQRAHYALTNQMEFFAEMTEAYFGMNDFFPFNRAELEHEEPEVFQLLADTWGGFAEDADVAK